MIVVSQMEPQLQVLFCDESTPNIFPILGQCRRPAPLSHQRSICPHNSNHSLRVRLIHRLSIPRRLVLFPGVSHLVKSITAAKYILTTLTALSLTWSPWLVTMSLDIYSHHLNHNKHHNASVNYQVRLVKRDLMMILHLV